MSRQYRHGAARWGALLLALAGAAHAAGAEPALGDEGVEIRLLTYNVHGLPSWVAGDDPPARMPRIAALAAGTGLVLLQEDFAHHEVLRASVQQRLVRRGNGPREPFDWLCPLCSGSGLTLLADLPESALRALHNVAYPTCAGWLGGENDCFASKGFQHARLELAAGIELDVVNTHLDAGDAPADRSARQGQLAALAAYLAREAEGRALVVAGDLNLANDRPDDVVLRESFARSLGLRDSGAAPRPAWRHLDWILVRDGSDVGLEVLDAGEDERFGPADAPLSDHPALFVRLRLSSSRPD